MEERRLANQTHPNRGHVDQNAVTGVSGTPARPRGNAAIREAK
ncbi:MAG: hypothetical protein OXH96_12655 [Spirochaetaceae bacterium]|nr:hypothetical protein [Spirochaetaceae bacterium]